MDCYTSAWQLRAQLEDGQLTPTQVVQAYLDRIASTDGQVRAYLTVLGDEALQRCRELERQSGSRGALWGLPIAIKDNLCTRGVRTSCGSRMLDTFIPPYSSTVVDRLESAGAVVLGKTNMDEFAMGSSTENSAFQVTRNPWDLTRVPGGSSGGSAAAVASGQAPLALGSDTGGSIRQPAAFCGVVGLKPTYGRVSRFGLVAFASSLDQIGPLARDVRDCALLLEVIAGHDPLDATSAQREVPSFSCNLEGDLRGLKIGQPRALLEGLDSQMRTRYEQACAALQDLGAQLVPVELSTIAAALAAYYIISPAEASSNLARYDGVRYGHRAADCQDVLAMFKKSRAEGFGAEVKRRIMLGTYALSSGYYDAYYHKAQLARTAIRRDFDAAFTACDVLALPTTPTPAFPVGDKVDDPLQMYLSDIYTVAANLAGLPALVVPSEPCNGLPTGLQLMGPAWSEAGLLKVGYAYQEGSGWARLRPELPAAAAG